MQFEIVNQNLFRGREIALPVGSAIHIARRWKAFETIENMKLLEDPKSLITFAISTEDWP
ncbi:hypothetical protein ACK83U_20625 (plasmid) [Rhizobium sp. WW22]|uniref:hypothetical protein n=1 Tax=Rhizobium sp. WW22 TaxID=3389070 RepID=UPI00399A918A